jgi:3-hydroxyacyl-CoA dehydrogenase
MFWADSIGLARIVDGLKAQGIEPAKLLVEKAAKGEKLTA